MPDAVGPFAEYQPEPGERAERAKVDIVLAVAADVLPIARVQSDVRGNTPEYWAERVARRVSAGAGELVVVARVDGDTAGYGTASLLPEHEDGAPAGWYLSGVTVAHAWRRKGIGRALTEWRMAWLRERDAEVWCFVSARNPASIDLHRALGFTEERRGPSFQGVTFGGGEGVLLVARA
ncbi:GNAT family N-acetyltransferase [Kitasatospora viridis]|uniref:Ribosomal protein S18 acetylase RimI-like enzyme n=1 Tax=Kitasatospora viridis TaxID=281105 RepID=A0A561S9H6_9ACTN|nr:GNAT family N-acetyltransferase [Kitasatospora viridis]TWF71455.1 ribosomal protein S18 acetylase RimI-like enzyme [Kitasatospora viridis]